VDSYGQVFFVDTGQGVWKIDPQGKLTLIHTLAYHWMRSTRKGTLHNPTLSASLIADPLRA